MKDVPSWKGDGWPVKKDHCIKIMGVNTKVVRSGNSSHGGTAKRTTNGQPMAKVTAQEKDNLKEF